MKVLLIDVDSKIPNLAHMKLSAWHKQHGDEVYLNCYHDPDLIYISCVFSKNGFRARCSGALSEKMGKKVLLGGSGISLNVRLPDLIEYICPDYSLYNSDYSMGFITRGCSRKCPFCIVPKKEGDIHFHAPLSDFLKHDKVLLLDNNLLAYEKHMDILKEIYDKNLKVSFNQGLDIRLINEENAELLSKIKYRDNEFKKKRLYFAWDNLKEEKIIINKLKILNSHGIKNRDMLFYILTGYDIKPENYTWDYFQDKDYYRFKNLSDPEIKPYVMVYEDRKDIPVLHHFERWVNRHIYKFCKFEDYNMGHSQKVIIHLKGDGK